MRYVCFTMVTGPAGGQEGERERRRKEDRDSGKAEFQTYNAKIEKYGYFRAAEVSIIIVKEPFDPLKRVKSLTVL